MVNNPFCGKQLAKYITYNKYKKEEPLISKFYTFSLGKPSQSKKYLCQKM